MGRSSKGSRDTLTGELFSDLPEAEKPNALMTTIEESATWSVDKSRLVEEYIRLYQMITYGGVYIDGFAAPQRQETDLDLWTLRRIVEIEPKWIQRFYVCDTDPSGVEMLRELKSEHEVDGRRISVFQGDFNDVVDTVLATGRIKPKTPCFAFLDQRTTECHWDTVIKLANWRRKRRIELLYFFPTGWLGRTIGGSTTKTGKIALDKWWGNSGWSGDHFPTRERARMELMRERFKHELGYEYVTAWPVFRSKSEDRMLYHLIHASTHPETNNLMRRAFIKVFGYRTGAPIVDEEQLALFADQNPH